MSATFTIATPGLAPLLRPRLHPTGFSTFTVHGYHRAMPMGRVVSDTPICQGCRRPYLPATPHHAADLGIVYAYCRHCLAASEYREATR